MATYDYHCAANDRRVTVAHKMSEALTTWGEVCAKASIELGDTPARTPVTKLIGLPLIASRSNMGCDAGPPIEDMRYKPSPAGPFVNPNRS